MLSIISRRRGFSWRPIEVAAGGGGLACALWRSHWPASICHRAGGGGFFGGPDDLAFSGLRASIRLLSVSRAPMVSLRNARPAPFASHSASWDSRWRRRVPTPLACCSIKLRLSLEGMRFSRPANLHLADQLIWSCAVGTRGGGGPLRDSGGGEWLGVGGAANDVAGAD